MHTWHMVLTTLVLFLVSWEDLSEGKSTQEKDDFSAVHKVHDHPKLPVNGHADVATPHTLTHVVKAFGWTQIVAICSDECVESTEGVYYELYKYRKNTTSMTETFRLFNKFEDVNIILFCDLLCIVEAFTLANTYDDFNTQQGYVTDRYKWLVVSDSDALPALESAIGVVSNVAFLARNVSQPVSALYTMYTAWWWPNGRKFLPLDTNALHLFSAFPNTEFGMNGQHIIVGINTWPLFAKRRVNVNGSVTWSGISIDLVEELAGLMNFSYTLKIPDDKQWGSPLDNGSWTGLVGDLQKKNTLLTVAPVTASHQRSTVMDFASQPFHVEDANVLIRKPSREDGAFTILLQPFHWQVWLSVLLAVPSMALVFWLAAQLRSWLFTEPCDLGNTFQGAVETSFRIIVAQGLVRTRRPGPERVMLAGWIILSLVLYAVYSGNLVATLTIYKPALPFTTIRELATNEEYKIGTMGGAYLVEMIRLSKDPSLNRIWSRIQRDAVSDPDILSLNHSLLVQKARLEKFAYITYGNAAEQALSDHSDLTMMSRRYMATYLPESIGLRKNSAYTSLATILTIQFRENGLLAYWKRKHMPRSISIESTTLASKIRLHHIQGPVYVMFGLVFLATVVLLVEIIVKSCRTARLCPTSGIDVLLRNKVELLLALQQSRN